MRPPAFTPLVRFVLFFAVTNVACMAAHAAIRRHSRQPNASDFAHWMSGVSYLNPTLVPSSPDHWLGGAGNWSTPSEWSAGEPDFNSDVFINTGNDNVTMDVSPGVHSLTLGGFSGSSILTSYGNKLSVTANLTINPSGTLNISSNNLISTVGGTLINAGTMNLSHTPGVQAANIVNSGTINLMPAQLSAGGSLNNSGAILGLDSFADIVSIGGAVNNSGRILLDGSLVVGGALTNQAAGLVAVQYLTVNGNLMNQGMVSGFTRGSQLTVDGQFVNSGTFDTSYAFATVGSLNNSGTVRVGDLTVNGNATNSGLINLGYYGPSDGQFFAIAGTLNNAPGGEVYIFGPYVAGSAQSLTNNGTLLVFNGGGFSTTNATNSGAIMTGGLGDDSLTISNRLTNNAGGVLALGSTGDVANAGYINNAGSVSIADGAILNVTGGVRAATNAFPGFLNSGTVLIAQGGTFSSPLTYAQTGGQTTVDGTLHVGGFGEANFAGGAVYGDGGTIQGNVISSAAFNIGDLPMTTGMMAIAGNYMQGASGSLAFDIASLTQYDQLNVSGRATLNGTMYVDLLNGYIPQIGNMFDIMNFASKSGTFSMVVGLPINNQEHFVLEYNATNLTLDVVAGPDQQASSGKGSAYYEPYVSDVMAGDNLLDPSGSLPSQTVPEPGSLILLASGIAGILTARRTNIV